MDNGVLADRFRPTRGLPLGVQGSLGGVQCAVCGVRCAVCTLTATGSSGFRCSKCARKSPQIWRTAGCASRYRSFSPLTSSCTHARTHTHTRARAQSNQRQHTCDKYAHACAQLLSARLRGRNVATVSTTHVFCVVSRNSTQHTQLATIQGTVQFGGRFIACVNPCMQAEHTLRHIVLAHRNTNAQAHI